MPDGRIIFERDPLLARYGIMLADRSEKLVLLDRVNAEISFHVQIDIKHVFRGASFSRDHVKNGLGNSVFIQVWGARIGDRGNRVLGYRIRVLVALCLYALVPLSTC